MSVWPIINSSDHTFLCTTPRIIPLAPMPPRTSIPHTLLGSYSSGHAPSRTYLLGLTPRVVLHLLWISRSGHTLSRCTRSDTCLLGCTFSGHATSSSHVLLFYKNKTGVWRVEYLIWNECDWYVVKELLLKTFMKRIGIAPIDDKVYRHLPEMVFSYMTNAKCQLMQW